MDALKFARISSASSVWDDSRGQAATSVFEHFEDEEEEGVVVVVGGITSSVVGGIVGVGVVVVVVDLIGSLSFSFSFPSFRPSSCLETQHPILCARSSVCFFSLRLKRTDLKRVKGRFLSGICE